MRKRILILAGLLLTGCATEQPAMQVINTAPTRASTALCFDAPITMGEPTIEVSRADRGASAFLGFDDPSTSTYDVFSYNRQSSDRGDRYIQQSVTEKTGSIQR